MTCVARMTCVPRMAMVCVLRHQPWGKKDARGQRKARNEGQDQ